MSAVPLNLHTDVSLCASNVQRRDKSNSVDKRGRDNWTERRQERRQADRKGEQNQIENFLKKIKRILLWHDFIGKTAASTSSGHAR